MREEFDNFGLVRVPFVKFSTGCSTHGNILLNNNLNSNLNLALNV